MNEENNVQVELADESSQSEPQRIYYAPPYQQEYYNENTGNGSGWGVASLVLGILAIVSVCCICCGNIIIGILGLIFGIISIAKKSGKEMGVAGLILSIISIILGVVLFLFLIFVGEVDTENGGVYNNYGNYYEDEYTKDYYEDYNDQIKQYLEQFFEQYDV